LIRDQNIDDHYRSVLLVIQDRLFTLESELAVGPEPVARSLPEIKKEDITLLENEIDSMNKTLPELKSFILPGGNTLVSYCHLARTVCRRAERLVIKMNETFTVKPANLIYLNRLSDYFFVLSRKLSFDTGAIETPWNPRV